jgi:hypothetical protein
MSVHIHGGAGLGGPRERRVATISERPYLVRLVGTKSAAPSRGRPLSGPWKRTWTCGSGDSLVIRLGPWKSRWLKGVCAFVWHHWGCVQLLALVGVRGEMWAGARRRDPCRRLVLYLGSRLPEADANAESTYAVRPSAAVIAVGPAAGRPASLPAPGCTYRPGPERARRAASPRHPCTL